MHERRSDRSRVAADDEQLNIDKAEGQIAFLIGPKRPPTVSELQRDDEGKTLKQMFCFIPIISETSGMPAKWISCNLRQTTFVCVCVFSHICFMPVPKYSFY